MPMKDTGIMSLFWEAKNNPKMYDNYKYWLKIKVINQTEKIM